MKQFVERINRLYKNYENLRHMLQSATLLLLYMDLELSDLATEIDADMNKPSSDDEERS